MIDKAGDFSFARLIDRHALKRKADLWKDAESVLKKGQFVLSAKNLAHFSLQKNK